MNILISRDNIRGDLKMFRQPSTLKILGISVLSFGLGVLLAFFLPAYFLVVIEAIVIVASGILYILQKH